MASFINALPGAVAQGLIWGIMAIGVFITFRVLDIADLTVDGSFCTGGAVCVMMILAGFNPAVAMLAAFIVGMGTGFATGEMAVKILKGEASVSEMEIGYAATVTPKYNAANCEALGLTVPAGYEAIG